MCCWLQETLHRHDHDVKAIQSDEKDDHHFAASQDQVADGLRDESGLIVTPLPSSTSILGQNNGELEEEEEDGKQEEATVGLLGKSDYKEADTGKLHETLYSSVTNSIDLLNNSWKKCMGYVTSINYVNLTLFVVPCQHKIRQYIFT